MLCLLEDSYRLSEWVIGRFRKMLFLYGVAQKTCPFQNLSNMNKSVFDDVGCGLPRFYDPIIVHMLEDIGWFTNAVMKNTPF